MKSARALAVALLACGCAAGVVDDPADVAPTEVPCALGRFVAGDFVALPAPATVELVLGFQGFVWIDLGVELSQAPAVDSIAKVAVAMSVDGLAPVSSALSTRFVAGGRAPLRVLMSPADVGKLKGRDAGLDLRLDVAGLRCFASAALALRDNDPCVHVDDSKGCTGGLPP